MKNIFGYLIILLFIGGTIQQAYLNEWRLSGIYLLSALLNVLFIM